MNKYEGPYGWSKSGQPLTTEEAVKQEASKEISTENLLNALHQQDESAEKVKEFVMPFDTKEEKVESNKVLIEEVQDETLVQVKSSGDYEWSFVCPSTVSSIFNIQKHGC